MDRYFLMGNNKGLSLLELSIALVVVAALGVAIVRSGFVVISNARIQQKSDSLKAVAQACRYYQARFGQWPVFAHDLIDKDFINTSILSQFQLAFTRKGQILLISDGQGRVEVAMPSMALARLDYAKNYANNKFKTTSVLAY